jgi:hypothetical protein
MYVDQSAKGNLGWKEYLSNHFVHLSVQYILLFNLVKSLCQTNYTQSLHLSYEKLVLRKVPFSNV